MAALTFAPLVNSVRTTITQAATAASPANGGTFPVANGAGFPAKGYCLVDQEVLHYDSISGNNLTMNATDGRGSGGSSAAPHTLGSIVYADVRVAAHLNELVDGSPNTLLAAKGDLLVATAANTPARLVVGPDSAVLEAQASETSGVRYVAKRPLVLIADTTVSTPTSSIDFSSIPATYKHLVLYLAVQRLSGVGFLQMQVNGSSSGYDSVWSRVIVNGISTGEGLADVGYYVAAISSSFIAAVKILLPDYANTTNYKLMLAKSGTPPGGYKHETYTGIWKSAAAINRLTLFPLDIGNFASGARATLYGMT